MRIFYVCSLILKCLTHSEPSVRAELMEQVPNIAMFLHESRPNFPAAFSRYLVPIVVRYLTDPNNQVGYIYIYIYKIIDLNSLTHFSRCGRQARLLFLFCWSRDLYLKLTWRPKFVQFCWTSQNPAAMTTTKSRQLQ